jgi:hypothetical protein
LDYLTAYPLKVTISYTKKRLRKTLIITLIYWVVFGIRLFPVYEFRYLDVLLFLIAGISTYQYFRERRHQYLTITEGELKRNDLWGRKIQIDEVVHIEKYAGDYILQTPTKKLRIDTHIIPPEALKELERILGQLQLTGPKP